MKWAVAFLLSCLLAGCGKDQKTEANSSPKAPVANSSSLSLSQIEKSWLAPGYSLELNAGGGTFGKDGLVCMISFSLATYSPILSIDGVALSSFPPAPEPPMPFVDTRCPANLSIGACADYIARAYATAEQTQASENAVVQAQAQQAATNQCAALSKQYALSLSVDGRTLYMCAMDDKSECIAFTTN